MAADLFVQALRPAARQIGVARGSCDRETGGDGKPQLGGHDVEVGGLTADQVLQLLEMKPVFEVEVVDESHSPRFPFVPGPRLLRGGGLAAGRRRTTTR